MLVGTEENKTVSQQKVVTQYPCHVAQTILDRIVLTCTCAYSDLVYINEQAWRSKEDIRKQALYIWSEIKACRYRGAHASGILPGGLSVKRRAAQINERLMGGKSYQNVDEWIACIRAHVQLFQVNTWVSCFCAGG
jgi:L-serine dehydratase